MTIVRTPKPKVSEVEEMIKYIETKYAERLTDLEGDFILAVKERTGKGFVLSEKMLDSLDRIWKKYVG